MVDGLVDGVTGGGRDCGQDCGMSVELDRRCQAVDGSWTWVEDGGRVVDV